MNHYQSLRRRIEKLESHFFPEPETVVTVYSLDDEGLPNWVCTVGRSNWMRKNDEPIPPEFLKYATPKARAIYKAKTEKPTEDRPPPDEQSSG